MVKVRDIKIVDLTPVIRNPKHMPKINAESISFVLEGVDNSVANAIRRCVLSELLVSAMVCERTTIVTNDLAIIGRMIQERIRQIPLMQTCPLDAKFELRVNSAPGQMFEVKTSNIKITYPGKGTRERPALKELPFNENITLLMLNPERSIVITDIGVEQRYNIAPEYAMHAAAFNAASVPVDVEPINQYDPNDGVTSRTQNAQVWRVLFTTNGTMPAKRVVMYACDTILARITAISEQIDSIRSENSEYTMVVAGETDTIGNLLSRTINRLYPEIGAAIHNVKNGSMTMRVQCTEDITDVYQYAVKDLTRIFRDIRKAFE